MQSMVINMEEAKLTTLAQIKAFLAGTTEVSFRVPKDERNQFIERVFKRFGYAPHGRADKGVLLRYIERMTGLSRQQVTRLVRQYRKDGKLTKRPQRVEFTKSRQSNDNALAESKNASVVRKHLGYTPGSTAQGVTARGDANARRGARTAGTIERQRLKKKPPHPVYRMEWLFILEEEREIIRRNA